MARRDWCRWSLATIFLASLLKTAEAQGACSIPDHIRGDFYTLQGASSASDDVSGQDRETSITDKKFSSDVVDGECVEIQETYDRVNALTTSRSDVKLLVFDPRGSGCYACNIIFYQTANVLQTRETACISKDNPTIENTCNAQAALITLFRKTLAIVNCKPTFEGVYHFTYEILAEGSGICSSAKSNIVACQEPGSPYVDNQVFEIRYAYCPGVKSSKDQNIRYQCMGTWIDEESKGVFSAVADLGQEIWKNKFRCLRTSRDQQTLDTTLRYTMSRSAECKVLLSEFDGPIKMVIKPVASFAQLSEIQPSCNLPKEFTGTWFTSVEYDSHVTINSTHIYFNTRLDQYNFEEVYYTCKQASKNLYLMSSITIGRCEIDYICFEFQERHHNIIRYRIGKPYRMTPDERAGDNFMSNKFYEACSFQAFTLDQSNRQWMYNTLILNPPAPVECPIAGKYLFVQKSDNSNNHYRTRIRGITEKPRVQVDCRHYESEVGVCRNDPKRISLDVERCATVDQNGAPIGEYDVADNYLQCVGYWYENMKSVLVTYDEEDSVSPYRCWVYERENLRFIKMSRSLRSACDPRQTTSSFKSTEGASLSLTLTENEREHDDCPQRYDTGIDPYKKLQTIYVVGSNAVTAVYTCSVLAVTSIAAVLLRL